MIYAETLQHGNPGNIETSQRFIATDPICKLYHLLVSILEQSLFYVRLCKIVDALEVLLRVMRQLCNRLVLANKTIILSACANCCRSPIMIN